MASSDPQAPMAAAMQWVSRIFAAAIMMVVPGLAGQWLDERLGTNFLVLLGFGGGLVGGMAYLIAQTKVAEQRRKADKAAREANATKTNESAVSDQTSDGN